MRKNEIVIKTPIGFILNIKEEKETLGYYCIMTFIFILGKNPI